MSAKAAVYPVQGKNSMICMTRTGQHDETEEEVRQNRRKEYLKWYLSKK